MSSEPGSGGKRPRARDGRGGTSSYRDDSGSISSTSSLVRPALSRSNGAVEDGEVEDGEVAIAPVAAAVGSVGSM